MKFRGIFKIGQKSTKSEIFKNALEPNHFILGQIVILYKPDRSILGPFYDRKSVDWMLFYEIHLQLSLLQEPWMAITILSHTPALIS